MCLTFWLPRLPGAGGGQNGPGTAGILGSRADAGPKKRPPQANGVMTSKWRFARAPMTGFPPPLRARPGQA
jgi:hypothetical protein